jgi:hypothetical protein
VCKKQYNKDNNKKQSYILRMDWYEWRELAQFYTEIRQ